MVILKDLGEFMPSAIYNVYSPKQQWERMWKSRTLDQEARLCEFRELRRHLLDILQPMRDPFVVEAGCGLGGWVSYLSEHGIRRVVGVDNYAPALNELKRQVPHALAIGADVRELPFSDGSVDACISLGVVEHFPGGPKPLILEMSRVLRPGGYLFLTVPYYNLLRRFLIHPLRAVVLNAKRKIQKCELYFVEYRFTQNELVEIVRECGFEFVKFATDEYEPTRLALGLFVDLPLFRGKDDWSLNLLGRLVRRSASFISPWLTTGGVLLLAKKSRSMPVRTTENCSLGVVA